MIVPRRVLVVAGALTAVAAVLGLAAGQNGQVTETQVIDAGAAIYTAETGGKRTDCVGLPGRGEVWIEVRCGDAGAIITYLFDERGRRLRLQEEPRT